MYKAFDMGVRAKESTSKTASTLNESKRSKVGSLYKKRSRGVRWTPPKVLNDRPIQKLNAPSTTTTSNTSYVSIWLTCAWIRCYGVPSMSSRGRIWATSTFAAALTNSCLGGWCWVWTTHISRFWKPSLLANGTSIYASRSMYAIDKSSIATSICWVPSNIPPVAGIYITCFPCWLKIAIWS